MKRDVNGMTEHELLAELVLQGRRAERERTIKHCIAAIIVIALVILGAVYIPRIVAPLQQIGESLEQIQRELDKVDQFLGDLGEDSAEKFRQTVENFSDVSERLEEFMDMLKNSGLDKLQSTLEGFNDTMGGILNFFRR